METEPTTAPSMIPMIGTIRELRSVTRRRNRKNTIVPTKEKTIATPIFVSSPADGTSTITRIRPSPAHSVVPVVDGSTKRFCVISCMIRPDIDIAAPARTSAMVRGMRVMANISPPPSAPSTS